MVDSEYFAVVEATTIQCDGTTRANKRCIRRTDRIGDNTHWRCHQHRESPFIIMDDPFDAPEPKPPEGGWLTPTCSFESHRWTMEIENGQVNVTCVDPCSNPEHFDPSGPIPTCHTGWESDDFSTQKPIPVELIYVDDSTTSGPWGPDEYGFWIEIRVADTNLPS